MSLMPSKYSFQKNYFKVNSFRISDCAKNVMDYTIIKCHHNRISEVEKSKRSRSLPRFCYNALMYILTLYPNILLKNVSLLFIAELKDNLLHSFPGIWRFICYVIQEFHIKL
jgi:hypothetical protein